MNRLSVYKAYVQFASGQGEKMRPIVILVDDSDGLSLDKSVLAIYSYKKKFNDEQTRDYYEKILYQIQDSKVAGLNPNMISYVNVSVVRIYPFRDLLEEAVFLGELSARDSRGVINKYNEYHSS